MRRFALVIALVATLVAAMPAAAQDVRPLEMMDIFDLEWASSPQISPDGSHVVYVRNFYDVMTDTSRSNLWLINVASGEQRPLTSGTNRNASPAWSPTGDRLLWVSNVDGGAQIWMRWMDTGQAARVTNLVRSPGSVTWSPDGNWISFSMFVPGSPQSIGTTLPTPPAGAEWAPAPRTITRLQFRADGAGFLPDGFSHIFVVPSEGGAARQLTEGDFNHGGHSWSPDSAAIVFSANRHDDWQYDPADSEVFELTLATGALRELTARHGPDGGPQVSPDGTQILYTGNDEQYLGYNNSELYVMNRDGSGVRRLMPEFDRSVAGARWSADGEGIWFQFTDHGVTKVAYLPAEVSAEPEVRAGDLGGQSLGRPYSSGQYSVADNGDIAFTLSRTDRPADVAVMVGGEMRQLTALNEDLLGHRDLGAVEEIWWESSFDGRRIQGWLVTPPGFDPDEDYPLVLEIHGGPFAAYGPHFAAEIQLYAAAGNVVFYTNPRGSSSYGQEFGNLIHHNYPGQDFDDLMSGVDAVIERGFIDTDRLYVTGGSGGGVLTAWIVGHTDRFAAAVSQKPVINWYSFVLSADSTGFFYRYWFPGFPWDHLEHYMERSPLHHAGNVTTPTMLLTGEEDWRTPMWETEQFYTALKLQKVDTAIVRIPEASHSIAARPSNLLRKVANVLQWFSMYPGDADGAEE
jgi:acylaminoacyl-peptidase